MKFAAGAGVNSRTLIHAAVRSARRRRELQTTVDSACTPTPAIAEIQVHVIQMAAITKAAKIIQRQLQRDHLIKTHSPKVRLALVQATAAAETGRQRWKISDEKASRLYGRTIAAASLMSSFLKGEERCILQLTGHPGDAVSRLYAEVTHIGEVRGYASGTSVPSEDAASSTPHAEARLAAAGSWDGKMSPGSSLTVTKILYNRATPVQSTVHCKEGDVESDVLSYFHHSEQVPSAMRLEVVTDAADGRILYCGGLLAQRIAGEGGIGGGAGTDEHDADAAEFAGGASPLSATTLADIQTRLSSSSSPTASGKPFSLHALHSQGVPLAEIARLLLPELGRDNVVDSIEEGARMQRIPLDFFCRCNKEKFALGLVRAGGQALLDELMHEHQQKLHGGGAEGDGAAVTTLSCQFCNAHYPLTAADLDKAKQVNESTAAAAGAAAQLGRESSPPSVASLTASSEADLAGQPPSPELR